MFISTLFSKWFDRDVLLHLRLPFSFYLLPIFCFALSQAPSVSWYNTSVIFVLIHFFIYPASNIYNSYMDKDEESIGALEAPPPVSNKMYYASIFLDSIGLILSLLISLQFCAIILLYILVSKAYSWHSIRLKKYPFLSWFVVSLFQGSYTYFFTHAFISETAVNSWFTHGNILGFIAAFFLVGAMYPLTQIYQHNEDKKRGDITLSLLLGIRGTFLFSALSFVIAVIVLYFYFLNGDNANHFFIFLLFLLPVLVNFIGWLFKCLRNPKEANFKNTMNINKISAACMTGCFILIYFLNQ